MDDYFYCPFCRMYTIDTWSPDDPEDRCPVCGNLRPDDAPNLYTEFPLDSRTRGNRKVYTVHNGRRMMEFVDDRTPYFVRVDPVDGDADPRFLVMDADGMYFALGDVPEPSGRGVVRTVVGDPNTRFNDNGPVLISYTTDPGHIGSLNRGNGRGRRGKKGWMTRR